MFTVKSLSTKISPESLKAINSENLKAADTSKMFKNCPNVKLDDLVKSNTAGVKNEDIPSE